MASIPATTSRQLYPGESVVVNEPDLVIVAGSFEVNGAAIPVNVRGKGFQVAYVSPGVFNVTFANAYPMLISAVASVQADTAATLDDLAAQVGVYTASTGVLQLLTNDFVATPALDDEDGPRVNFVAVFHRRSSLSTTYTA